MNILFLSIYEINDSNSGYIYADLIREFSKHNHNIYAVTPTRTGETTHFIDDNGVTIVKIKNGQIQKTGKIKKVINLLTLENKTIKALKKYVKGVKFDLIISMASSLSYAKTSCYFKKRCKAINYLLVKDIFPQNAVDIGMLKTKGIMGFVYRHFCKKEKKLYSNADFIGCMSQANADYILAHHPEINNKKVTVVPNSIEPQDVSLTKEERLAMRKKYDIPLDKVVFVYGGNLGKPQGIPFIIDCLRSQKDNQNVFFFIVGDGTEYNKLDQAFTNNQQENVKLLKRLPREDFDSMLAACDAGMIFLDGRFTIPNYPSRLLSYMQAGLPVFACTDTNTDVGKDIVQGNFGWWCENGNLTDFVDIIQTIDVNDCKNKGNLSRHYLLEYFSVCGCYETIMEAAPI
ncbi:MAG: glycosyltransferase family 4 protein [Clostridia bacterium]|nr:glycosyltransferase family 4 protein [Clostridia bacterium]